MTASAARFLAISRRSDAGQRLFALLIAVAFALQSFLTQTHIHGSAAGFGGDLFAKFSAENPATGKSPSDSSPLDCPYCQAVAHSGAFFMPTAPILGLPADIGEHFALPVFVRAIKSAATLNARSRAPPAR